MLLNFKVLYSKIFRDFMILCWSKIFRDFMILCSKMFPDFKILYSKIFRDFATSLLCSGCVFTLQNLKKTYLTKEQIQKYRNYIIHSTMKQDICHLNKHLQFFKFTNSYQCTLNFSLLTIGLLFGETNK